MPKLYLLRHGATTRNGLFLGQSDPPLSETGRAQAALVPLPGCSLYSSPLRRALETAQIAAGSALVQVLNDLREISYGAWDGLSWETIMQRDTELASMKERDWFAITPPGGEVWADFQARVNRALDEVLKNDTPAIIVAHQAVNAQIAFRLAGTPPAEFNQQHCQLLEYDI